MKVLKRVLAGGLLVALAVPLGVVAGFAGATTACSPSTGHTVCTESATASLAAGTDTIEAPATVSWSATLDGFNRTVRATLPVTVVTGTGSGTGWRAEATMTTLETGAGKKLATTAVRLNGSSSTATSTTGPTASCVATSTCTLPTLTGVTFPFVVPAGTAAPTPGVFYSSKATKGMGAIDLPFCAWLHVVGGTTAGTYSSTVTLSVVTGP